LHVVSNSTWKHGRLAVQLHAPLDLILVDAADAATGVVSADFANWRGVVDTFGTLVVNRTGVGPR